MARSRRGRGHARSIGEVGQFSYSADTILPRSRNSGSSGETTSYWTVSSPRSLAAGEELRSSAKTSSWLPEDIVAPPTTEPVTEGDFKREDIDRVLRDL